MLVSPRSQTRSKDRPAWRHPHSSRCLQGLQPVAAAALDPSAPAPSPAPSTVGSAARRRTAAAAGPRASGPAIAWTGREAEAVMTIHADLILMLRDECNRHQRDSSLLRWRASPRHLRLCPRSRHGLRIGLHCHSPHHCRLSRGTPSAVVWTVRWLHHL